MREIDRDIEGWVYGNCYGAAVALHRLTGWPLGGLTAIRNSQRGAQMAHTWVVDPDGQAWDAGGPLHMAEVHADFITSERVPPADVRYETYADEADFMERQRVLAGHDWPQCESWFEDVVPRAEVAMADKVLPKWEPLAEAVRVFAEEVFGEPLPAP